MTPIQGSELLVAAWSITAILAFANGYTVFGWVAVVLAVIDLILGVINA